ncbi:UNVERIFIED_CONTAM: hypothetical protein B566_EDAN018198 [Ephemera danica]|nr:hypothetical protein B566_EDAN018198 [Ephemera danica]
MAYKLQDGYEKANSSNLPRVDAFMLANFFSAAEKFIQPEIRNVKTAKNMRAEYGDSSIGYVQLKREGIISHLRAGVCPETWTRKQSYNVTLSMDDRTILNVDCLDCKGSKGGCKHSVALIAWLHRRSEEPSPTEELCYWKKSKLSRVGTTLKAITAREMCGLPEEEEDEDRGSNTFLNEVVDCLKQESCSTSNLLNQFKPSLHALSMHSLIFNFVNEGSSDFDLFLKFVSTQLQNQDLAVISKETILQAESVLWKELRFARVTASKLYSVAQCNTPYGATTKLLLGATKVKDNKYMVRGRNLESDILNVVQKILCVKISKVGIVLHENYSIFGASPDGITEKFVVEIKAPFFEKTFSNYISEHNEPTIRYKLQILLQMAICNKDYGYFCVADPKFESNNIVTIVKVNRDDDLLKSYLNKAQCFWSKHRSGLQFLVYLLLYVIHLLRLLQMKQKLHNLEIKIEQVVCNYNVILEILAEKFYWAKLRRRETSDSTLRPFGPKAVKEL